VDCHVKKAVHSLEILQHKPQKIEDVVLSSTSLNGIFQRVQLNSYKKCILKAFLTDKEQLIKDGIQYLKERFAATGNSLSLATSLFSIF
jgi:hypothetical protein